MHSHDHRLIIQVESKLKILPSTEQPIHENLSQKLFLKGNLANHLKISGYICSNPKDLVVIYENFENH